MYSLFSVSCFLTFFISGLTSLVFEILKLSTFVSAAVSTTLTVFLVLVNLGLTFLTFLKVLIILLIFKSKGFSQNTCLPLLRLVFFGGVAGQEGIEPPTYGFGGHRSAN